MVTIERQILDHLKQLTRSQQQQVLDYVRCLSPARPQGTPGSVLKQFVGAIPKDDLDRMEAAIETDLEQIDPDAW